MKIAVAGRGGSGKTTLAGTLARVLAIPYQDMMARYSVPAADHTRLLLMGRVDYVEPAECALLMPPCVV